MEKSIIDKICNVKELTDKIDFNVKRLRETGISVKPLLNRCNLCNGYDIKCAGYHPVNHYKEARR